MQEMLYPSSYIKAKKLGKVCALISDGRFSSGTSGLSIGHVSPEAAEGGPIRIDIPKRKFEFLVPDDVLARRRSAVRDLDQLVERRKG